MVGNNNLFNLRRKKAKYESETGNNSAPLIIKNNPMQGAQNKLTLVQVKALNPESGRGA